MSFYSNEDLLTLGFKSLGTNVLISTKASIFNAANISIGSNVRIDDFVVLSAGKGGLSIGNYIHIAVFSSLIGAGRIEINDFCNISSRVSIYSSSDDYSGETMTNPMIPEALKAVHHEQVVLHRHVIVGCGSVILPGVTLHEGVAIGALSLVTLDCPPFGIYAGTPAKFIKKRSQKMIGLADNLL